MDDLKVGDLHIHLDRTAPAFLRLDWLTPCSTAKPLELLGPFFEHVLSEARAGGRGIDMHFEVLVYLNSSCIAALVRLIRRAREVNVALRLYYAAELKWQAVTFELLERAIHSAMDLRAGATVEFMPTRAPPA
jgi:hypothetical protein